MKFSPCLALLLVPYLAAAPHSASHSRPLPFGLTPQGAIIVPVSVNGSGPVSFLLDTGSNGSIISDELVTEIGAGVVARTTLMSAGGHREALVARIEHLALGSASADCVLATIAAAADLNLPDVAASGRTVQGVIGQDVLSRLRYTIDYRMRRILWREAGADAPQHASGFELEREDDRFLVRLQQADRELRLVPDSGSEALVLFDHADTMADPALASTPVELTGVAGTRVARPAVVRTLRVGATTLMDVRAVIIERGKGERSVDGLLPLHLFARVTFNGPERQLFIEER